MDRSALSSWVEKELAKGVSKRQLGLSLGVSGTTIGAWIEEKFDSLSDDSIRAIAFRKKESARAVAEWLDVPVPEGLDIPYKITTIESRLAQLEQALAYSSQQRLIAEDARDRLYKSLIQKGVDLYQPSVQAEIKELVGLMQADPVLFERFLLGAFGIVPFEEKDLKHHAQLLKQLTDEPWTAIELKRILAQ